MSYSVNNRNRTFKLKIPKDRLRILVCNYLGIILFILALGFLEEYPIFKWTLLPASVIVLWVGVLLSHKYIASRSGTIVEVAAKFNFFISAACAVVISAISVIIWSG